MKLPCELFFVVVFLADKINKVEMLIRYKNIHFITTTRKDSCGSGVIRSANVSDFAGFY
jgi:hypothetical protein